MRMLFRVRGGEGGGGGGGDGDGRSFLEERGGCSPISSYGGRLHPRSGFPPPARGEMLHFLESGIWLRVGLLFVCCDRC